MFWLSLCVLYSTCARTLLWESKASTLGWVSALLGLWPSAGRLVWCWIPRWLPGCLCLLCWDWVCIMLLLFLVTTSPYRASQLLLLFSLGRHPREVSVISCFWLHTALGLLTYCCFASPVTKQQRLDVMPMTELKRQMQYMHLYIFFSCEKRRNFISHRFIFFELLLFFTV